MKPRTIDALKEVFRDEEASVEVAKIATNFLLEMATEDDFLLAFNKYRSIKSEHLNDQ